jgi:hypothetical protein
MKATKAHKLEAVNFTLILKDGKRRKLHAIQTAGTGTDNFLEQYKTQLSSNPSMVERIIIHSVVPCK